MAVYSWIPDVVKIVLGNNLGTGEHVSLSPADRGLGTYVIGLTGTGKSTLLLNMMVQDVEAGHGLTLLDPHGDLAPAVLERVPASRAQDVIYLDFGDTKTVPGFDIFCSPPSSDAADQASQQDGVVEAFYKLLGKDSWGPRIYRLLNHIAVTFRENPGCTLTEMPYLLTSQAFRHFCMKNLAPMSSTYEFWKDYDRKSAAAQEAYRESTITKIERFTDNPILKHIMGQPGKVIDFAGVLQDKKILIVRMPRGVLKAATRFVGYLFADRLLNAAFSRESIPEAQRTFHAIYCDEFQYFATPDFEEFIAGGRKYGIGLLLAHQWRDQLDREMQAATVAARSSIVFQVNTTDAPSLSRGFAAPTFPAIEEEVTIPANPWDVVNKKGHPDPYVMTFVQQIQSDITAIERQLRVIVQQRGLIPSLRASVEEQINHHLNTYLYRVLTGQTSQDPYAGLEAILQGAWAVNEDSVTCVGGNLKSLGEILADGRMVARTKEPSRRATEISQGLASLPSFHAKCKLMQSGGVTECTIKTNPPTGTQPSSIAQEIMLRSREKYCTKASEVDRKLREFQKELEEVAAEETITEPGASLFDTPPTRY